MSLSAGSRLGPYEITGLLGSGGMGEVYRARDTKLGRDVALKILPELFASDPERLSRFQREAQVLASLNHPNIGAIYGLEESDPSAGSGQVALRALVLELVEGSTLADVIARDVTESSRLPQASAPSASEAWPAAAALSPERRGWGPGAVREVGPRGIPINDALPIARQIAEALEAAHEHGIIHRDLKPANIKLRPDGTVKVLDFGLAKLAGPAAFDGAQAREAGHYEPPGGVRLQADLSQSPTITSPAATRAGIILGTAAYMSPEQARGKPLDKRTDIWAFGCVLYEMLTGRRAFEGAEITDVLARIIEREPDFSALPAGTPPAIRRLLRRSLEKDRKRRLSDAADARLEIDEALTTPVSGVPGELAPAGPISLRASRYGGQEGPALRTAGWRRAAASVGVVVSAAAFAGAAVWFTMRPSPPRVSRFTITPPSAAALTISGADRDLAITPDGTRIVYAGASGSALFVRALDQLDATRLTGLGAPRGPFLSPDGQWIGFADGLSALKKMALSGGPAVLLSRLDGAPRGATWGPNEIIVFATNNVATGLQQIPAAGGEPTVLTRPNRAGDEADHLWPEFLPDGEAVLFTITATIGGLDAASIAILDLRTGAQTILIRGGSHAHYVRSGHLVYAAAGGRCARSPSISRIGR